MKDELPNPASEGYRTAHEQNSDGSYRLTVMPADLVCRKPHKSDDYLRNTEAQGYVFEVSDAMIDAVADKLVSGFHLPRRISKKMEEVYRLRHHDFEGLSEVDAARAANMKPDAVRRLMWEMCKLAPQLFPILTPSQARVWHLWHQEGMSLSMIGGVMDLSYNAVHIRLSRVKKKLDYHKALRERLKTLSPHEFEQLENETGIEAKF